MSPQTTLAQADAVVIGAGIIGSAIAYQLNRQSDHRVVILDERPPVGGMSGRTFGQIRLHYSNALMLKLAMRGYEVLANWSREVGYGDPGYVPMGYLLIVVEAQLKALNRNIELARSLGIDTRFVGPDEIKALEPAIETGTLAGGAYDPAGGYIDVTRMVLSWLTGAQENGVRLMTGLRAEAIETHNGRVTGVATPQGRIETPLVVNATGPWGRELLAPLGINLPLEARRLDMMYMRQPPNRAQIGCCITDGNSNVVIRPDMGRDLLAVAYPPEMPLMGDSDGPASARDEEDHLARIAKSFAERLPDFVDAKPIRAVSGTYDITPDWHPILGWAPGIEGLYLAVGFSGHGLKLSPAIGEVVAAMVLGKEPAFDIHPLRFERFAEREPMYLAYGPSARA
jgi:sarcosine oxidase subunit beta